MKIISHRANLVGPDRKNENRPDQIQRVLSLGFDVEIDVWWFEQSGYCLGHDYPTYQISQDFLFQDGLWCHAKSILTFEKMMEEGVHCFWHETDRLTLTSKGIPWCYPNNYCRNGITVLIGPLLPSVEIFGICTDYPLTIKNNLIHSSQ